MAYLSLYRKWRPQDFSDVVGQGYVVKTLQNSLESGRISHAYLFAGPRGTGKTTLARLLAKGLNCEGGPTPHICGECQQCRAIAEGRALNVIEIDGASNRGIEEVRELREQARYAPTEGRYKVYIIDEVHMLTPEAFNALLKTLEEPPEHVIFMFATTDPHKIPATILSRCQRYDLRRFPVNEIAERLQVVLEAEGRHGEDRALHLIARHAEGGMRDALGILDQCLSYAQEITVDVVVEVLGTVGRERLETFAKSLAAGDSHACMQAVDELYQEGRDVLQFTRSFIQHLREQLSVKEPLMSFPDLFYALEVFSQCEKEMRYAFDVKLPLELAVLKFVDLPSHVQQLQVKVEGLEKELQTIKSQGLVSAQNTKGAQQTEAETVKMDGSDVERLAAVAENWERFLQTLRSERLVQPEAFLREGTPVRLQGKLLTLAFPKERGFHKASIEQEKHRVPAERVMSKFFGHTMEIACVTGNPQEFRPSGSENPDSAQQPTRQPAKEQQSADEGAGDSQEEQQTPQGTEESVDSTVAAALKAFGGKVVKVEDKEKGGE